MRQAVCRIGHPLRPDQSGGQEPAGVPWRGNQPRQPAHQLQRQSPKHAQRVVGGNEAQNEGPVLSSIGIANTFETRGISSINLQGYSSFGRSNGSLGSRDNSWQISEDFTPLKGCHSFAFGAQMDYQRSWQLAGIVLALGSLTFQPTFTAQLAPTPQGQLAPVANTGDSFTDFLLGFPITGLMAGLPVVPVRGTRFTPFFQDSWRMTGTLTLNYGVSWFPEGPPTPQSWAQSAVHGFDTRTGLLTDAALGQIDPQIIAADWKNLSPRVGLACKPAFLKATVFRAGAGISYSEMPTQRERRSRRAFRPHLLGPHPPSDPTCSEGALVTDGTYPVLPAKRATFRSSPTVSPGYKTFGDGRPAAPKVQAVVRKRILVHPGENS